MTSIKWLGNPLGQDWRTPLDVFQRLNEHFNFTVDCCADYYNHLLPLYWTKENDCLKQDWHGHRIFCNPPFTKLPSQLMPKIKEADLFLMVLMLNQLTIKAIKLYPPDYIMIPPKRIKFYKSPTTTNPTFGSCFLLWSAEKPPNLSEYNLLKWIS